MGVHVAARQAGLVEHEAENARSIVRRFEKWAALWRTGLLCSHGHALRNP